MKRRHALERLAVVGSVPFAGCSSSIGSGGTVLGRIEVINSSFVANRIRLMVERDGEELLDRKLSVAAIDAEDGQRGVVIEPVWSETAGRYTVRALHYDDSEDRESSSWEDTFTRAVYNSYYGDSHEDPGCLGAVVTISSRADTENAAIGIGPTSMENPCGARKSQ
ncbi:MAG: hypothetical protein V5A38_02590 [Halolamina sp.]|uniref:hypothetical protein n=1 Tax=Halolamina sp. TaxID=1940283 RepID=UPI002FC3D699